MNNNRTPSSKASSKPSSALKVRSHVRAGISVVYNQPVTHASGDPWSWAHPADF